MGAFLSMRVVNGPDFALRLRNVVLKDYRPLWPYAARPLRNAVAEQFATRGTVGAHGAWAALSPRYLERKFRQYGEQQIEVASGAMYEALMADDAFNYEAGRMTYGPRDPRIAEYAYYQQTGFRTRLGQSRVESRKSKSKAAEEPRKAFVEARRLFDWTAETVHQVSRALAGGYVVICRRKGYAIWQQGMAASEWPMQQISPAEARMAGMAFYGS